MRILGIDPGYHRCGYAVVTGNPNTPAIEAAGLITTQTGLPFATRLQEIGRDFTSLLETYTPQVLVLEGLHFGTNVTTGLKVAQVRGVLTYLAIQKGLHLIEPTPNELKSAFTGNGRASKADMRRMASMVFGPGAPTQDDTVDALALAWYGLGAGVRVRV